MAWRSKCGARRSRYRPILRRDSGGRGKTDKARFMNLAEGSLEECRYYLILVQDLGHGDTTKLSATAEEVSRLLNAYAAAILTSAS